ncbi:histone PARylation factor 1 isoform X1 [Microplitis demolitor]|uniref:histone PARylation factor 1 isoform X1 n=1 Tax=Microplitis demolitor TaxID=69319 RepID=UPI0004CDD368|nr:histone PARylation factor 1 isoform X1 [Microplitis demolitor]
MDSRDLFKAFYDDPRVACQYGVRCYQKNPEHHEKYKHPPATQQSNRGKTSTKKGKKRKLNDDCENDDSESSRKLKNKKDDECQQVVDKREISPSPSISTDDDDFVCDEEDIDRIMKEAAVEKPITCNSNNSDTNDLITENSEMSTSKHNDDKINTSNDNSEETETSLAAKKKIISELFLVEMPDDFYKFYDFCCSLSKDDPVSSLKSVDLKLVGPYDVLAGKIIKYSDDDKEKYLRHWRYFYDTPEFQTVLKGNDKDGLHYGYWRDECKINPAFVAKNSANKDHKIIPVAPNIFGAVLTHVEERLKVAGPFEKAKISRIQQSLKNYAKKHDISLDKSSADLQKRNRDAVAKTFHGAGIVVPYDKKTQLGYRQLALTDSHLLKLLNQIEKADCNEIRQSLMSKLEEVVRLATIAADECDFGTPLELGHSLFSSGVKYVQRIALQMFALAYNLLKRPEFLKIAEAHIANRKKGCDLSVL